VDVIVGFPGETDELFLETYNFLNELNLSYLHVFTYSERANTTAIKLGDPVPMSVRKERSRQLHILSEKKKRQFYEEQIGTSRTLLIEQEENEGWHEGFTENYVKVKLPIASNRQNTFVTVQLTGIDRDGSMLCRILD
jgi:threonylcarbamoyladenosine tRNA methylthiotransferase MtaB